MAEERIDGLREKVMQKITSIQQLVERYRAMETYGVDMSNFKYWIAAPEDDYMIDSDHILNTGNDAIALCAELKKQISLKKSLDGLCALLVSVASLDDYKDVYHSLVDWAKRGVPLITELNKHTTDNIMSGREQLIKHEKTMLFGKAITEFHLYYLLSNKWFYILAHASNKYSMKILRDGLKDVKRATVAHAEAFNLRNQMEIPVANPKYSFAHDDILITQINRILDTFKRYKKLADACDSVESQRLFFDRMLENFRPVIDDCESPAAKAKHDKIIAKVYAESDYAQYVIVSGGQTGVDRAALDSARELSYRYGGWLPKGRRTEDGVLGEKYIGMKEMPTDDYIKRTEQNVIDSDRTIVICYGEPEGGTKRTVEFCVQHQKPYLVVDLNCDKIQMIYDAMKFLEDADGQRINFAGPRASKAPTIYKEAKNFIENVFIHLEQQKKRREEDK